MNKETAHQVVTHYLLSKYLHVPVSIMPSSTMVFAHCFAVYYQSEEYIKTGNLAHMLAGNGAILVDKKTAQVFETGTALPTKTYVDALAACGDPLATPTCNICIGSFLTVYDKTKAIQLLKQKIGVSSINAKLIIDKVLKNSPQVVNAGTLVNTAEVITQLLAYGFESKQLWSNQL